MQHLHRMKTQHTMKVPCNVGAKTHTLLLLYTSHDTYLYIPCMIPTYTYRAWYLPIHTVHDTYLYIPCMIPTYTYRAWYLPIHTAHDTYLYIPRMIPTYTYRAWYLLIHTVHDTYLYIPCHYQSTPTRKHRYSCHHSCCNTRLCDKRLPELCIRWCLF